MRWGAIVEVEIVCLDGLVDEGLELREGGLGWNVESRDDKGVQRWIALA